MPSPHPDDAPSAAGAPRWLLLIHQLPAKPDYVRVKVRRRLRRFGAVALKNAVYVLPWTDGALEDFQWLVREIAADGGDALLTAVTFVAGVTDQQVETLFNRDRDADYVEIARLAAQASDDDAGELARLRRRFDEVVALDRFAAPGRRAAAEALAGLQARARRPIASADAAPPGDARPHGRTWVTRAGVHVDRIASAWLIRRFIDPAARFHFVGPDGHRPEPGTLRFDMFDAEYTHEGAWCTFETLVHRFALDDPALVALGEIVHDIDLKERTFGRPETAGVARLVDGVVAAYDSDEERVHHGGAVLDVLYAGFTARERPPDERAP